MTFETYIGTHLDRLCRFSAVLTGDRSTADDVLQAVLERALRQWDHIGDVDSPHAYVRRMLVNEYLSWRRRMTRSVPVADLAALLPSSPDHADARGDAIELLGLVQALPSRQRAAVVLRYYEDLDIGEIASVLGCTESTVRSNIARALASLRVASATVSGREGR